MNSAIKQNRWSNFPPVVSNLAFSFRINQMIGCYSSCLQLSFCFVKFIEFHPLLSPTRQLKKQTDIILAVATWRTRCPCLCVSAVGYSEILSWSRTRVSNVQSVLCSALITLSIRVQLRRQHSHYYLIAKQCHSIVNCRLPLSPRLLSFKRDPSLSNDKVTA